MGMKSLIYHKIKKVHKHLNHMDEKFFIIQEKESDLMTALEQLQTKIAELEVTMTSANVLLQALGEYIRTHPIVNNDPALLAMVDNLSVAMAAQQAAVNANPVPAA